MRAAGYGLQILTKSSGPVPTDFSVFIPRARSDIDNTTSSEPHYLLPAARDAYLVFEDICLLVNGEQPSFLKLQNLPRTFGLELIESVLSDFSNVFVSVGPSPRCTGSMQIALNCSPGFSIRNSYICFGHCCRHYSFERWQRSRLSVLRSA